MATASIFYVNIKLTDDDVRLVRLESSRDYDNLVDFVMRHDPESYKLRSKMMFSFDYKGAHGEISTPLQLHHAIHQDKSVKELRLELRPQLKA